MTYDCKLAVESCTKYNKGIGFTSSSDLTLVNYLFSKKIKLFCKNYEQEVSLVTEDGEYYRWIDMNSNAFNEEDLKDFIKPNIYYCACTFDWSNTRIKKCAVNRSSFLALTDDEEIYYNNEIYNFHIHKKIIENKITCFGCGYNFCVIVTDNNKVYRWGAQYDTDDTDTSVRISYDKQLCEITQLSGKTIVKVVCGYYYILLLTDKGDVYVWGLNAYKQLDIIKHNLTPSLNMLNIPNVEKISDIAVKNNLSFVKSSKDKVIYIWSGLRNLPAGQRSFLFEVSILNCEYTNMFDVSNILSGYSPISMADVYTDEDTSILTDLTHLFNDCSTSDLKIKVEGKSICVHKAILRIRSLYYRNMFKDNTWIESTQHEHEVTCHSSKEYETYLRYLRYLYTGMIDQLSMNELLDLLILADAHCEENLERYCIWMIRKEMTASNVIFVHNVAMYCNKEELKKYCFTFMVKNYTTVSQQESFEQMESDIKETLLTKVKNISLTAQISGGRPSSSERSQECLCC